ncbi:sensor domain-containing diguanylate cyclase [Rhodoferax bucti]|uniref:sensor domain-containing diguanylate cyclase n=1 Tax=Rhodoferax bucti TaxID=2576305 RepID=UPI001109E2BB|nr:7TM-DISM domain-containing protein [Rhodoferax bucti]
MPYLLSRLLLVLALWMGTAAVLAASTWPVSPETRTLGDGTRSQELHGPVLQWLEKGRSATIDTAHATSFNSAPGSKAFGLDADNTLWLKIRIVRASGNTDRWTLNIPQPYLDSVTLYQQREGQWHSQRAGDTHPQSSWAVRGPYPEFDLWLPAGQPQDVYLQVRNFKPLPLPLRIATTSSRESERLLEGTVSGVVLGLLLTLVVLSLMRYADFRNISDLGAAVYSLLVGVSLAQFNGVLNALVWGESPAWADYANSVLPVLAVGMALIYMRHLYALASHFPRYDKVLGAMGLGALGSVLSYVLVDRATADTIAGAVLLAGTATGLVATLLNWRAGSPIGAWLVWTYAPQLTLLLWMTLEAGGYLPTFWQLRYLMTLAVAASVPALVYALGRATHDRKEIALRADHLPTQDALTGLLTPNAFQTHLEDAYHRAISSREPVALVLVNVVNHEHIRASMGDPVAEQCLLRAVIKLHRILRDVDPAARVDSARFAMLLEGVDSRQALTERLVKLVASGLIPLQGLQPEVTLQFQAACVMLHHNPVEPTKVLGELAGVLASISPRTRRPIRFLEPVPTQAAPMQAL